MKFLLINYEYPPIGAGAATATQAIARQLVKLGHNVTVLTAAYADLPTLRVEDGVTVRRIKCLRRRPDRCSIVEMTSFLLSAVASLLFIIPKIRPDGAIAFFSIPCGPIALLANALFRIPYVISLRGGDVPGLVPEIEGTHRLLQSMRRVSLENAVAVVANAEGLRTLSEAHDPLRVRVIPNGVDAEFFQPALHPANGAPYRIVFTGRFQAQKNVGLLLDECAALRQLTPQPFELHLIGDGPLRLELHGHAQRLKLNVVWHGWTGREELRAVYQRSDCFVNPSFYEGMPNAVLEAMACGLPVIASDIPGNDAVVQHGVTGLLFSLNEPHALRNALAQLVNDGAAGCRMGNAGRASAERDFSWMTVARQYAEVFAAA
jgi:glycosyltransferase involved in cell wall biosynthesis